jgi:23S rRNA (uracil1939-C5)-methyltransferase
MTPVSRAIESIKQSQPYAGGMQLTPDRLVAGGDAMARDTDGRVVFVEGALPGELVEVEIELAKKDFARGRLVEILERSPLRDSPSCAHRRNGCGGCDWMHLQPDAQLDAKVEIVRESLRRIARLDPVVVDGLVHSGGAVSPFGYRTTIRVVGGPNGSVGYRAAGSNDVVEVTSCPDRRLEAVPTPRGDRGRRGRRADPAHLRRHRRRDGHLGQEVPQEHPGRAPEVHIGERAWLTERVAGHDLRVSAGSFFQSGVQAAELLVASVKAAAPELAGARHAVDAYGGVGLFAVTAMESAQHVTVIESSKSGCLDAEHNLNGRASRVVRADVSGWTPPTGDGSTPSVDVIVADPARPGLAKPGVAALSAAGPLCSCW